ncbi:MAG: DUF4082 domain-containing protein [Bacteroidetes bacterium]|nr:DUF4082 domain-containing protein [Bacteroidota bacterium]
MKQLLTVAILLTTLIAMSVNKSNAQVKQFNPGGAKPADKQLVKQKPFYGPEETLLDSFGRNHPALKFNVENAAQIPYELGYVFQSSKKGQVTQLAVRMPRDGIQTGPELIYTVSLWDYDSQQLLAQTNITTVDIRYTAKTLDNPVPIAANKKYVVSVFIKPVNKTQTSWSYYSMLLPGANNSAANFIPFTQGSLTLLNTQTGLTNVAAFPATTNYHKDIITGLCDIVFKATEK